ncbi:MAG: adenylosuccinate synthetase, partial [Planctomycetaceae bacterium]
GRDRESLQNLGEKLDRDTQGRWVSEALGRSASQLPNDAIIVVDSVRILDQIDCIRRGFGPQVVHVHLEASESDLRKRYLGRKRKDIQELASYDDVLKNETERAVPMLREKADVVINTTWSDERDVLIRAASHLGLYGRGCHKVVDVLIGGQYGSEGKGQVAAYLSKEYDLLVRVGGPNAGHKVYKTDEPDTFHTLPSGSRVSSAELLLGPGAVIDVATLLKEIGALQIEPDRLSIDPQALIITDEDRENEKRLVEEIGSTGQGVGAAMSRRILQRDEHVQLAKHVKALEPYVRPSWIRLEERMRDPRVRILLEGTQGTGLSLYHGSYPHVTSRDTTVSGCLAEAGISPGHLRRTIMVTRTLPIRVESPKGKGKTSGPLKQELTFKQIAERCSVPEGEIRKTERTSTTNKTRRIGEFDWELFKKAVFLNAPTDIALTFVDYIDQRNQNARRFDQLTPDTLRFIEEVEQVANAPVSLISTRFHYRSIIDRRSW